MSVATVWLCCGVLRPEMESLLRGGKITGTLVFLDSMLHMDPPKLEGKLGAAFDAIGPTKGVVLVYGDCCSHMRELSQRPSVARVDAINCVQMLLGRESYRQWMRRQAFILLPEWTLRWREVLQTEMGISADLVGDFMRESHRRLLYVDTGVVPVPRAILDECAATVGLAWEVERVTLDGLLSLLLQAEQSLEKTPA